MDGWMDMQWSPGQQSGSSSIHQHTKNLTAASYSLGGGNSHDERQEILMNSLNGVRLRQLANRMHAGSPPHPRRVHVLTSFPCPPWRPNWFLAAISCSTLLAFLLPFVRLPFFFFFLFVWRRCWMERWPQMIFFVFLNGEQRVTERQCGGTTEG